MSEQTYQGTIQNVRLLTPTILAIQCESTPTMSYSAGQYVMMSFPSSPANPAEGPPPEWPIAIASGPSDPSIEFCIRNVEGGSMTAHLGHLQPETTIQMRGPMGNFSYHNPNRQPVVFIATGTGIAPLRSMMRSTEFQSDAPQTTLLIGAQTEEEIPYMQEWSESTLQITPVLSQAPEEWQGERGWVTDYMKKAPDSWYSPNALYYICGQWDMLNLTKEILQQHGIPNESIRPSL